MKYRLVLAGLLLTMGAWAQSAAPGDEAHERKIADIRKLMVLTGGDKMANQILDQMGASLKATGSSSEKYFEEFRKEFDLKKVFEMQIAAYDRYLTAEDVKAVVAFYESQAGKHLIDALPQITGEMMQQSMQMSQEIAQKLMKKSQEQK